MGFGWRCSNCTFEHHGPGERCVMCGELRVTRQQMHDFVRGVPVPSTDIIDPPPTQLRQPTSPAAGRGPALQQTTLLSKLSTTTTATTAAAAAAAPVPPKRPPCTAPLTTTTTMIVNNPYSKISTTAPSKSKPKPPPVAAAAAGTASAATGVGGPGPRPGGAAAAAAAAPARPNSATTAAGNQQNAPLRQQSFFAGRPQSASSGSAGTGGGTANAPLRQQTFGAGGATVRTDNNPQLELNNSNSNFQHRPNNSRKRPAPSSRPHPPPPPPIRAAVPVLSYRPGPVPLDSSTVGDWIYPVHQEYTTRQYQLEMTEKALFHNTLVSLPTGLGKTLIAAVVLYNYHRWFPTGKVLFCAPTLPLVRQQVEACYNVMGIPTDVTAVLTGQLSPSDREQFWKDRQVFFCTPQTVQRDMEQGRCPAREVVCVVLDEAHKASGEYAYCKVIQLLEGAGAKARIVGLSATPGVNIKAIQNVVEALRINVIESRSDDHPTVEPYTHGRREEIVSVMQASAARSIQHALNDMIGPQLDTLRSAGALSSRFSGNATVTTYTILKARQDHQARNPNNNDGRLFGHFHAAQMLVQLRDGLQRHGVGMVRTKLLSLRNERQRGVMASLVKSPEFEKLWDQVCQVTGGSMSQANATVHETLANNPKLTALKRILTEHFERSRACAAAAADTSDKISSTRAIVFSQFRDSVSEIVTVLKAGEPIIRPRHFIGQSKGSKQAAVGDTNSTGGQQLKGMKQSEQNQVIREFKANVYNVLVCTCIGEEGLDIGEVDLIVNFDMVNNLRMIQRVGRTGRKRDGHVVCLVYEGAEQRTLDKSRRSERNLHHALKNPNAFKCSPTVPMLPSKPVRFDKEMVFSQRFHFSQVGGNKKGQSSKSTTRSLSSSRWRLSDAENAERLEVLGRFSALRIQGSDLPALRRRLLTARTLKQSSSTATAGGSANDRKNSYSTGRTTGLLQRFETNFNSIYPGPALSTTATIIKRTRTRTGRGGEDSTLNLLFPLAPTTTPTDAPDTGSWNKKRSSNDPSRLQGSTDRVVPQAGPAPSCHGGNAAVAASSSKESHSSPHGVVIVNRYARNTTNTNNNNNNNNNGGIGQGSTASSRPTGTTASSSRLLDVSDRQTTRASSKQVPIVNRYARNFGGPNRSTTARSSDQNIAASMSVGYRAQGELERASLHHTAGSSNNVRPAGQDSRTKMQQQESTERRAPDPADPMNAAESTSRTHAESAGQTGQAPNVKSGEAEVPCPPSDEFFLPTPPDSSSSEDDDENGTGEHEDESVVSERKEAVLADTSNNPDKEGVQAAPQKECLDDDFSLPTQDSSSEDESGAEGGGSDLDDETLRISLKDRKNGEDRTQLEAHDEGETSRSAGVPEQVSGGNSRACASRAIDSIGNDQDHDPQKPAVSKRAPLAIDDTPDSAHRANPAQPRPRRRIEETPASCEAASQRPSRVRFSIDAPGLSAAGSLTEESNSSQLLNQRRSRPSRRTVLAIVDTPVSKDEWTAPRPRSERSTGLAFEDTPASSEPVPGRPRHTDSAVDLLVDTQTSDVVKNRNVEDNVDDIVCAVCGSGESIDEDPIILCDGPGGDAECNVCVHMSCYSVSLDLPAADDEWRCDPCSFRHEGRAGIIKCGACGGEDGALKNVGNSKWQHVKCNANEGGKRRLKRLRQKGDEKVEVGGKGDIKAKRRHLEELSVNKPREERPSRQHQRSKYHRFIDYEAGIESDDAGGDDEDGDVAAIEEEEAFNSSFINDSTQLGYSQDELDRVDPDDPDAGRGFSDHQALDLERERGNEFATPALNRRALKRKRGETMADTPPSAASSEKGLGNMHFIRSVMEHHRLGGRAKDIEEAYNHLETEGGAAADRSDDSEEEDEG